MNLFLKAVINGFGLALGAALFKKVARELGIDEDAEKKDNQTIPAPAPNV